MASRTLDFNKNGQTYVFRYAPGDEDAVVEKLMSLAEDAQSPLDWLDAATLSFQVTQRAAVDCYGSMGPYDTIA
jgi:hypothetical protein